MLLIVVAAATVAYATKMLVQAASRAAQVQRRTRTSLTVRALTLRLVLMPSESYTDPTEDEDVPGDADIDAKNGAAADESSIDSTEDENEPGVAGIDTKAGVVDASTVAGADAKAGADAEGCTNSTEDEDEPRCAGADTWAGAATEGCAGLSEDLDEPRGAGMH